MKIALVVPGGVDRSGEYRVVPVLLWLIERLSRHVELHVFALRQEPRPSRYRLLGADIHNAGGRFPSVRSVANLISEHQEAPFALIHSIWAGSPGAVAALTGRLLGVPILVHIAGGELVNLPEVGYGGRRGFRGRCYTDAALAAASLITAASSPIRALVDRSGHPSELLPLGVDLVRWPVVPPRRRDPDRPARLVHVASLNRVKDQATLLRAAGVLVQRHIRFHLDVIGEDTLGGEVHRLVESGGLASHVTLHGFLPQQLLRPMVERADLLVLSSRHEAGPVVVAEAAAVGVPTVGTAVGQLVDWAPDAAVTVPVGDPMALASAINRLLDDDEERMRIARAAQARAIAESADWTAERILHHYAQLTGRLGAP